MRYQLLCWLLRLLVRCGLDELDLENAVLRHQLKVLRRGGGRPRFTNADRAFLAAAARLFSRDRRTSFLVGSDTLLRWHRELSRRRRRASRRPGRPPLDTEIKKLIVRLGRENPRWGYLRIRGELLKLGVDVSATTIATVPRQAGLGSAPRRIGPTWTQFLRMQACGLLSPGASSEEDSPEDLALARQDLPASGNGDPGTAEEDDPIHDPFLCIDGLVARTIRRSMARLSGTSAADPGRCQKWNGTGSMHDESNLPVRSSFFTPTGTARWMGTADRDIYWSDSGIIEALVERLSGGL